MRPWMKSTLIVFVFLVVACCMSLGGVLFYYDFDPSQDDAGTFHPLVYYKITPTTILGDIEKGNVENTFHLMDIEPTVFPDIHPSGSFSWTQEDYMKIANAHLFYQTGETMEDGWSVYSRGKFRITSCSDEMRGFDSGEIRLFKREPGGYDVLATDIRPLEEILMFGYRRFKAIPFDGRYVPAKVIENSLTAEGALQIAEQAIGREMRQKLSNDGCYITVSYSRDEYWNIHYRWFKKDDLEFSLWVDVNVNDEQYKIKSHVYKCERTICP